MPRNTRRNNNNSDTDDDLPPLLPRNNIDDSSDEDSVPPLQSRHARDSDDDLPPLLNRHDDSSSDEVDSDDDLPALVPRGGDGDDSSDDDDDMPPLVARAPVDDSSDDDTDDELPPLLPRNGNDSDEEEEEEESDDDDDYYYEDGGYNNYGNLGDILAGEDVNELGQRLSSMGLPPEAIREAMMAAADMGPDRSNPTNHPPAATPRSSRNNSEQRAESVPRREEPATQESPQEPRQRNRRRANRGRRRNETRRQRANRRRRERNQRRNQNQQEESPDTPQPAMSTRSSEDSSDESDILVTTNLTYLLGKDVLESTAAPYIKKKEEPCPCCYTRFGVELADTLVVANECGHAYCIPCIADLWEKSKRPTAPLEFNCPMCRIPLPLETLDESVAPLVVQVPGLKERLKDLPIPLGEAVEVARKLLFQYMFATEEVFRVLDSMLTDYLQSSLRRSQSLSPHEKQQIYEEARRPVDALRTECAELISRRRMIRDPESAEFHAIQKRIDEIHSTAIPAARENARLFIFERINSAGTMGVETADGVVEVDFHALHINEAKKQFDDEVLPVLQAIGSVTIVVGRGKHSEGGVAKLMPALKRHVQQHGYSRQLRYYAVPGNKGALRIEWRSR